MEATANEILSAWTVARDELKLDRLVRIFLRDSMYNLHLTKILEEPDAVLALRLVCWYSMCEIHSSTKKTK